MKSLLIKFLFVCFLIMFQSCASNVEKMHASNEVVYVQKGSARIDVYNLKDNYISHEYLEYLQRRDGVYGEFGGGFRLCSNIEFYCMFGGISVLVPKVRSNQIEWSFGGIECLLEQSEGQRQQVYCKRGQVWTRFQYSKENGIVTYVRSSDPEHEFVLLGGSGLFAM